MAAKPQSIEVSQQTLQQWHAAGCNSARAARDNNIRPSTFKDRLEQARRDFPDWEPYRALEIAPLPDGDVVDDEYVASLCKAFQRRDERERAKKWREIRLNVEGPYGIMFVGDEHLDDPHCNIPLMLRHLDLTAENEALFAFFMGDMLNSWPMYGRLAKLQSKQEMSKAKGIQLAKWATGKYGAKTIGRIWGNHDDWDEVLTSLLSEMIGGQFPTFDWEAKVVIKSKSGRPLRLNAAHNFKGSSQFHKEHGLQREAMDGEEADIIAAGHHHNFVMQQEQHSKRGHIYWLLRARGYKWHDEYASKNGFGQQPAGASVLAVVNPNAKTAENFIKCFADPEVGVEYLSWLRNR